MQSIERCHGDRMLAIIDLLEEHGKLTTSELADKLGEEQKPTRKSIRRLRDRDRVKSMVSIGTGTREKVHWLTGENNE